MHDENLNEELKLQISDVDSTLQRMPKEMHDDLLSYLIHRLNSGTLRRNMRTARYIKIDKLISTWMKMTYTDGQRESREDNTGRQQALPFNVPLLATHLEDTVSFFSEVFSPMGANIYKVPDAEQGEEIKLLVKYMNRDAAASQAYANICSALRSLVKYNLGGFEVYYQRGDGTVGIDSPGNRWKALSMYNVMWDPEIHTVTDIPLEAEWAAYAELTSTMRLIRDARKGKYSRIRLLLESASETAKDTSGIGHNSKGQRVTKFYVAPPDDPNLGLDAADSSQAAQGQASESVQWARYGAELPGDGGTSIRGHELVTMYCWVNPYQFGLLEDAGQDEESALSLWKFVIADASQVIYAEPAIPLDEQLRSSDGHAEIPIYLAHMIDDDTKEAQRSIMELMRGFQRLASFLMNTYTAGIRKHIWGIKIGDPNAVDLSKLEEGDVAGVLKSKVQGRDVRTILHDVTTATGVEGAMKALDEVMGVMKTLFPSQALPSQVASIDRAVKSQVSVVMQGALRRMHMTARLLDSSLLMPVRLASVRNLQLYESQASFNSLSLEQLATVLGSGVEQVNAERTSQLLSDLLFALLQNPESAQRYDISKLYSYLSTVMNLRVDLGDFLVPQQAQGAESDGNGNTGGAQQGTS